MEGCNVAFHLAALVGIPYSLVSPLSYIRTNIDGTYNVLESAKLHQLDQDTNWHLHNVIIWFSSLPHL